MDLPNKKYSIIYADPPWLYRDKALAGNRGLKYNVMGLDELSNLPVQRICNTNCFLFMWVTFPQLDNGLRIIESWGFKYKTAAFVWTKVYANGNTFLGMGNYTRSNAEVCLLGIKGKPKRINGGIRQVIQSIPGIHSKKPDEARNRIVGLCGDIPRIELFARQRVIGWDSWGDQLLD